MHWNNCNYKQYHKDVKNKQIRVWDLFGRIESAMICICRMDSRKTLKVFSKEDFSSIGSSCYEVYEVVCW